MNELDQIQESKAVIKAMATWPCQMEFTKDADDPNQLA
jgi:hypothetical protein